MTYKFYSRLRGEGHEVINNFENAQYYGELRCVWSFGPDFVC